MRSHHGWDASVNNAQDLARGSAVDGVAVGLSEELHTATLRQVQLGEIIAALTSHGELVLSRTGTACASAQAGGAPMPEAASMGIGDVPAAELVRGADELACVDAPADEAELRRLLGQHAALMARVAELQAELDEAHRHVAHLKTALETNRTIGAAVGVLMAKHAATQGEAFDLLRVISQTTNRKLYEIAEEVLLTGTLPCPPARKVQRLANRAHLG
jgi:ANTAR domain